MTVEFVKDKEDAFMSFVLYKNVTDEFSILCKYLHSYTSLNTQTTHFHQATVEVITIHYYIQLAILPFLWHKGSNPIPENIKNPQHYCVVHNKIRTRKRN